MSKPLRYKQEIATNQTKKNPMCKAKFTKITNNFICAEHDEKEKVCRKKWNMETNVSFTIYLILFIGICVPVSIRWLLIISGLNVDYT